MAEPEFEKKVVTGSNWQVSGPVANGEPKEAASRGLKVRSPDRKSGYRRRRETGTNIAAIINFVIFQLIRIKYIINIINSIDY